MDCFGKGDDSTLIAMGAPWGGGSYDCQIQLIDANNIRIRKKRLTPLYMWNKSDVLNKWPTSIVVNDNKMYVSFYPLEGSTWNTEYTDTAYVTIFSYPGLDSLTTIKADACTGPKREVCSRGQLLTTHYSPLTTDYSLIPSILPA